MTESQWVKPAFIGAAVGAAFGVLIVGAFGFTTGGWMTRAGADRMSLAMAHETMIAALVPVCLDLAATDPERATKLAALRDTPVEDRRDVVMNSGWATVPGSDAPSHDLAQACMSALVLDTPG